MNRVIYLFLLLLTFYSCKKSDKERITRLVKEWEGKEIVFLQDMVFTRYGIDTLDYQISDADWKIISYIDSIGCTSCKLQFHRWETIMLEMDSVSGISIPFVFIFHPKDKRDFSELSYLMRRDKFDYPVCIDNEDEFCKKNKFPTENILHYYLIDKQNKVVAIGDPFQNPKIKELYLSILCGDSKKEKISNTTGVLVEQPLVDLGEFDWTITQTIGFNLRNQCKKPLVIYDVITSCGCISVNYPKQPIEPEKDALVTVKYKAEKQEFFNKKLTVYANVNAPLQLTVKGSAK